MNPCYPIHRIPHRIARYARTGHWRHRTVHHVAHHVSALAVTGCVAGAAGVGIGAGVIGWRLRTILPPLPVEIIYVPEPTSLALLAVGVVALVAVQFLRFRMTQLLPGSK